MLDIDALPGRKFTAQIQAIDPLIDANGRSVGIRACIDNRQLQLRPGMFARVNTVFGVREGARVIPEEAIVPQGGRQFVIKLLGGLDEKTRTTQRVEVKVGLRSPGKVEILEGLEAGDTVVTAGQQRVQRDGTVVTVADLASARAAGPSSSASAPSAATSAPGSSSGLAPSNAAASPTPTPAPLAPVVVSGPNPCGAVVAELPAASKESRSSAPPERRPSAAARDPA